MGMGCIRGDSLIDSLSPIKPIISRYASLNECGWVQYR